MAREFRVGRLWKKIVWTTRLALLGATPWSALVLAYESIAMPMRNRMGLSLSGYSARIRKNGDSRLVHFAGTYDELLVLTEIFLDEAYELPKAVRRHGVTRIIDAGANAGFVSVYYSLAYPDAIIHAYEPSASVTPLLDKNAAGLPNVTVYHEAIAAEDGTIGFHSDTKKNIASSIYDRQTGVSSVSVPCVNLDRALSRIGGETVIKMDIEGAEFSVLKTCTRKDQIAYLTGEAHGDIAERDNNELVRTLAATHSVSLNAVAHAKRAIIRAIRIGIPVNVTYVLPSLIIGGIEHQFVRQMKAVDRRVVTPSLVTLFQYEGRETLYPSLPEMSVTRLEGNSLFSRITKIATLCRALKQLDSDVIVSSMFSGNAAAAIACWLLGAPHIPREHNTYEEKGRFHHRADRWIVRHAYQAVAVSETVASFAAHAIGVSVGAYSVIGNGVQAVDMPHDALAQTREDVRMRKGIGMDNDVFLNVARLKKAKNQAALVEAFSAFASDTPGARLLLVGDGNERPAIDKEIAARNLEGVVWRLGHRDDVAALYAASDAFILPSLREGFPNVALEAMSYGLPVIMTEGIGGQKELVTDGVEGILCTTDVAGITHALNRWKGLSASQRRSMSEAAIEKSRSYSLDSIVSRYSDLFIHAALRGKADKRTIIS